MEIDNHGDTHGNLYPISEVHKFKWHRRCRGHTAGIETCQKMNALHVFILTYTLKKLSSGAASIFKLDDIHLSHAIPGKNATFNACYCVIK